MTIDKKAEELLARIDNKTGAMMKCGCDICERNYEDARQMIASALRQQLESAAERVRTKGREFGISISVDDACAAILKED